MAKRSTESSARFLGPRWSSVWGQYSPTEFSLLARADRSRPASCLLSEHACRAKRARRRTRSKCSCRSESATLASSSRAVVGFSESGSVRAMSPPTGEQAVPTARCPIDREKKEQNLAPGGGRTPGQSAPLGLTMPANTVLYRATGRGRTKQDRLAGARHRESREPSYHGPTTRAGSGGTARALDAADAPRSPQSCSLPQRRVGLPRPATRDRTAGHRRLARVAPAPQRPLRRPADSVNGHGFSCLSRSHPDP